MSATTAADPGASAISTGSGSSGTHSHSHSHSSAGVSAAAAMPPSGSGSGATDDKPAKRRTAKLDLLVIRWSLFLEAFLYLAIAFNPSQEVLSLIHI